MEGVEVPPGPVIHALEEDGGLVELVDELVGRKEIPHSDEREDERGGDELLPVDGVGLERVRGGAHELRDEGWRRIDTRLGRMAEKSEMCARFRDCESVHLRTQPGPWGDDDVACPLPCVCVFGGREGASARC